VYESGIPLVKTPTKAPAACQGRVSLTKIATYTKVVWKFTPSETLPDVLQLIQRESGGSRGEADLSPIVDVELMDEMD